MLEIYFARHVHDWPSQNIKGSLIQHFFEMGIIAIHFVGEESWDPNDYTKRSNQGRSAIDYMNKCNEKPGGKHIFVSYKVGNKTKVLHGTPKINSKCFLREYTRAESDVPLKLLFLENITPVNIDEFPFAYLLAPKQSTFVRWHQCERVANNFILGEDLNPLNPDSYLPWALEVLCEEYLRVFENLKHKLYASGGPLKEFDIVGICENGERIFSQVKNNVPQRELNRFRDCIKFNTLKKIKDKYIYFCKNSSIPTTNMAPLEFIPLETVLSKMKSKSGDKYLKRLMYASL